MPSFMRFIPLPKAFAALGALSFLTASSAGESASPPQPTVSKIIV